MARLRFPGRPGQRIGRNYVSFVYDDLKLNAETCGLTQSKIESGLKLFYDLMGYSDEEEFDGFTAEDLAEAEATLAVKLKQKQALERLLASEVSSPSGSEVDKLFTSSDSDDTSTTSSSVRRCRGMRDIARKSYDKMIKEGLQKPSASTDKSISVKSKNPVKQNVVEKTQSSTDTRTANTVEPTKKDVGNSNQCVQEAGPVKKSIVRRLLEKAQHQVKTRRRRRRSMRPNVKKKYRAKFMYSPASKYSKLRQKLPTILESPPCKDKIAKKPLKASSNANNKGVVCYDSSNSVLSKGEVNPKSKRSFRSRKRFVLPSISARSSRKIIPRKRYIDDFDISGRKALDEDSQCSRSSLSGSSETISAMDGGSSPEDSQQEDCRQSKKLQKKVGLLERPLVVEGKRPWKPSLKVQMKLSQMNYEHPFALKRGDDSSGTSSGSFKDIIKPDMVSRYAEKMAQKPKEKPEGCKRSVVEDKSSDDSDNEKPGDKLEKVAAKIEKLLKSQWEGRLKDPLQPPPDFGSVAQWRTDQQSMRTSSQRRTKSIIRKARLQLKKRNLNLRTRKTDMDNNMADGREKSAEPVFFDRISGFIPEVPVPEVNVPFKDSVCASTPIESDPNVKCVVCGFSKIHSSSEKLYDQVACEACNKFFESFAKTPKQYFCTKDGNCSLDGSKESLTRKAINSRCKACWLKVCMEKFTVSAFLRDQLVKYVPRLDVPPHNPLLEVENLEEPEPKPAVEEGNVRGPRIKHVCRRAAVALGLPRATFSENKDSKESFNLSALPQEEKQKILETVPHEKEVVESGPASSELAVVPLPKTSRQQAPLKKKPRKDFNKVKNKVHLLKKSSLLIHKEQKRKKLLMKKSHKHSFKKSLKLKKSEMKKTLKFSYKSAVKTSLMKSSSSPKVVSMKRPARAKKFRKVRCKQCEGCLAEDCGECAYCLDKKKFGGPNLIKQACMYRRCLRPVMPASERKPAPPSDGKPPGQGGPSLSPSSSSSSPTSPDENSSCGSSCSSSSSSSSSGSSNSSSSSTQSSSSSTSSSSSGGDVVAGREAELCTDPAFQQCCSRPAPSLQELVCSSLGSDQQKIYFAEELYRDSTEEEEEDTIVYEDSSSMIELRNASYAPSLIYGAPRDESEYSTPSFSSGPGPKRQRRAGSRDGRKSQFEKDEDMYGSAGSGGQDSNGEDDEDSDEDSQKKKHYIYADYWEDYDFDRISSQGLALISSQQVPLPCVCFLCGSVGQEKLIFCVICCEPYHTFCLPEDDVPPEENLENWCCKRCQCCSVCGLKNNLLKCKKCQSTYHSECLTPHYPSKPSRKKRIWMCPKCVKCKSCGTTSPSAPNSGFLWNFDLLLCQPCTKLTDKGIECF